MTLTELSIKRPTLIAVIFITLGLVGIFSYLQLRYELLPKITPPVITIVTVYPGASPGEVENSVTKVVEDAVSSIDKVSKVTSTSQEAASLVAVEFQQSADIDKSLQEAQRKVNEVISRLPSEVKAPVLSKFALDELPVLRLGLTANMPSKDFYRFLEDKIQPRLARVQGVGQVFLVGGDEREIKVNLDAERMKSFGLSILQVTEAIQSANLDFPTGKIVDTDGQYTVRMAGKLGSLDELRQLVVARSGQGDIRLSDIANIEDGQKERTTISRIDGVTSVGALVVKQTDANGVEVSRLVRGEIGRLEKEYSQDGLKFNIAHDSSIFTMDAANAVKEDLLLAVILVALVMLLFLHSLRNSLIVMVSIPASLLSTFIAMYALGFSLNLMTLLAMSLVIGILVDDSIVVLENIYHHLERGEEKRAAALRGRNEIGFAALAITLVDVVVFLPLSLVSGLIGDIMREFALVVVFSTLMSLFVSFTITPLLASRFGRLGGVSPKSILGRFAAGFESFYTRMSNLYLRALAWAMGHRRTVMAAAGALFAATLALPMAGFIGSEFMSKTDSGEFAVTIELPSGAPLEKTNQVSRQVENMLSGYPEIENVFANVGSSSEGLLGQSSNNTVALNISLVPRSERSRSTDEIADEIKGLVAQIPGLKVRVNPIGLFGTADETPIVIGVSGADQEGIRRGADHVAGLLRAIPGTADVRLSAADGKPETRIEIDREKMAAFGLSLAEVGASLRVALTGNDDSKFRDGANDYDIRVQLDEWDRSRTSDLGRLPLVNRAGQAVELGQFARTYQATGPTKLERSDRDNFIYVFSQLAGRPSGSVAEDFKKALAEKPLPTGLKLRYLGELEMQEDSFASLGLAFLAGIVFVYLIMVALYNSFVYPLVVLVSIPLAVIGALLALGLTLKSLNIFSILGIIMLIGLVGKNAILLVDRTNQMRARGLSVSDALMESAQSRLRPILMTTLTMIVAMMPIALSISPGAEWKSGLAWALVGGLSSSLFLTLLVVPVVYLNVERWRVTIPAFFCRTYGWFTKSPCPKERPGEVVTFPKNLGSQEV